MNRARPTDTQFASVYLLLVALCTLLAVGLIIAMGVV